MSTSFDLNRTGLIRTAYQLVWRLQAGQDPTAEELEMGTDFLNVVLKDAQNYGIMLRKLERTTIPLTSGTYVYALDSSTLDVDPMTPYVTDANGVDLPLKLISRGQYMELNNKATTTGQPTQLYVEKLQTISAILYPVPDVQWVSMTLPRVVVIDDMSTAATVTGLQAKYLRAIMLGVAHMIAYASGLNEKARMLKKDFDECLSTAKNDDTERGATVFRPRYGLRMGKF